jgi:hypothetical protein
VAEPPERLSAKPMVLISTALPRRLFKEYDPFTLSAGRANVYLIIEYFSKPFYAHESVHADFIYPY